MKVNIVDILDRRLVVTEQKLIASRRVQANRLEAIRRLELERKEHQSLMQYLWPTDSDPITVELMWNASQDGRHHDRVLKKLRAIDSHFRLELEQITEKQAFYRRTLAGIRHRVDFIRDRQKSEERRALRRRLAANAEVTGRQHLE